MLEVAVCCPPQVPLNSELEKLHIRTLPYYVYGLHEKSKRHRLQAAAGVVRACLEFRPDVIYLNQCGCYKVALPRQHCWVCRSWRTSAYSRMRPILQDKAPARVGFGALSPLVRQLRRKSDGSNNSTPSSSIEFMTRTLLRCRRFRTRPRQRGSSTASPASGDWCQSKARMFLSAHWHIEGLRGRVGMSVRWGRRRKFC